MKTVAFKGFDGWVDIFAGGPQTDMNGVAHDGDAMIDKAVSLFDPGYHEPPAVVGHPKTDDPAYGWVSAIKAEDVGGQKVLFAQFKDVDPQFETLVKERRFPKRSAAFYPDGSLRHVGFLGAMPPAVKGLKNIAFAGGEAASVFEFAEPRAWTWNAIAKVFRRLREYFIEKEGAEAADTIIPEWYIEDVSDEERRASQPIQEEEAMKFSEFFQAFNFFKKMGGKDEDIDLIPGGPTATLPASGGQFTEADIEAAKQKAAEEAQEKTEAKFAEKESAAAKKTRDADIAKWVEDKVTAGIIPPAICDSGLVAFMQGLDDDVIEFAEGEDKQSPVDWMKGFLDQMGSSPLFAEIATKEAAGAASAGSYEVLTDKV